MKPDSFRFDWALNSELRGHSPGPSYASEGPVALNINPFLISDIHNVKNRRDISLW
jgi:hypothetical protein